MALRAFVDASVGVPAPARFRRRALTPLAVFLPVLVALVDGGSGECDADLDSDADTPDAPPDTVDLWRAFWFHVVARGYLADAAHVAAYGTAFAALAAKAPALVHASSVNYLETELAFSSVLQRDASASDASVVRLRGALTALLPATLHPAVRSLGFAQAAFLLSVHAVETLRAQSAGNCARMLRYFANAAVASSALLLPAVEAVADLVVAAYVRETTTRRWAIDSAPPPADAAAGRVKAQVRELMVAACHHLELVSRWAQRFADRILLAFPQALLDTSVIGTLLELVQLVWKSCRAAQDDQFVPVYWFTSRTLGITLQLPDSIAYRKTLFARVSECARRWLELAGRAAPMELETLLLAYLAAPSDDDLNCEPHVGHALALEVGNAIRYGLSPAEDAADVLTPNASPFTYRLGLRSYLRGHTRRGEDLAEIKRELAAVYAQAVVGRADTVGLPQPDMRSITSRLHQATHSVVAAASVDRELVRLLVWVPLTLFDESMMRAAMHMWTTLIVERPAVEVLLMVELTVAWTWLIQQHRGLFAQRFEPKNPFAARMSYTPSDKSARARAHASIACALTPHSLLIEFITQRFDSVKHLPDTNFNVINATLRILQVTFDNAPRITTNALARAPLFMLVQLGFKLLNLGFEASPILECTLRRGLYRLAFRWFALPPRWSFSGSKVSLAREIRILIDTCNTVSADFPLAALPTTPTGTGTAAATATAGPGLAVDPAVSASVTSLADPDDAAQAAAAPILGVSREQLRQRALSNRSLLLLLLENEISRMATWANPTSQPLDYFPDTSRFTRTAEMSESGWQNVVLDAWVADPALAVQLLHRFSHPIIRRELTGLICRFPGELVDEPDALPLLVDQLQYSSSSAASTASAATGLGGTGTGGISAPAAASSLFGNLGSALTFREQKFLLYWTPVPPITSTVYLASSNFARNPLALQYAMRALESFPVEVTFFYIPQLVQALRHDTLGYVERAILSSAQISQHFAHQIIWNMNANMFKDEESLQPDSLKPVLDRIVQRIVNSLSGEDRVYYEKEFAFFGEVTGISGKLKPFIKKSKPEKKRKIDEEMRKIKVEPGVYLPSNPDGTVVDIDYDSGRPLQSHAKAPFMATFIISRPRDAANDEVQALLEEEERTVTPSTDIPDDNDADAAEAIQLLPVIGGSPSLGAQIGIEIARPEDDNQADNDAESAATAAAATAVSEPIDTGYLSSKLAMTRIEARRTISSAISDAPDLIGIMSQQQQQHSGTGSGRPSREYSANRASRQISSVLPTSSSLTESTNHYRGSTAEQLSAMTTEIAQTEDTARETETKIENKGQVISRLSAIFKVGDDCRQDVLALQLIAVFKNIFTSCGLDLYLYPYRVVATAPGCGVIDVIPNSISRDQMGREKVNSLSDYFATRYHGVDSIQYQQARSNFVQSLAAYSVLSYLLQFKDRHNGNIMLDDQGHIVHIDFGFILDIAPGGINFESAPFKLTTEYIQVMGGSADAQPYRLFCELCIKAYLASRPYADRIIQIVSLMLDSGLPCFKGESTLVKLKGRFQLEKNEREAAVFMAERISDSYENKRTVLYDQFQKATNGIPH
ncbi:hypothetical protein BX661DRAFT_184003 [Kickxella alabastrina]|uniref:uncharacterized protein n=1 Tax=Kickxella alabastrina TaxID=61397 RepID=UPI00221F0305|nr:uncharacterized protein BX661DRAFT_184003 [Kickxella alabastrina]KAI7826423.1 hypothetical protein BX661DRAFT_184003 [Kickxella alabastrina]